MIEIYGTKHDIYLKVQILQKRNTYFCLDGNSEKAT